jgi:hypothetical protein
MALLLISSRNARPQRRARPEMPVLVEGYKLLPRLAFPLLSRVDQAVWLIPTSKWGCTAFSQRGSLWSIAVRTCDPERALTNFLARQAVLAQREGRSYNAGEVPLHSRSLHASAHSPKR